MRRGAAPSTARLAGVLGRGERQRRGRAGARAARAIAGGEGVLDARLDRHARPQRQVGGRRRQLDQRERVAERGLEERGRRRPGAAGGRRGCSSTAAAVARSRPRERERRAGRRRRRRGSRSRIASASASRRRAANRIARERGLVDPLRVVDHDQQRALLGAARPAGSASRRRSGSGRARRRREPERARAAPSACGGGSSSSRSSAGRSSASRPANGISASDSTPAARSTVMPASLRDGVLEQRGLADPGLAGDHERLARAEPGARRGAGRSGPAPRRGRSPCRDPTVRRPCHARHTDVRPGRAPHHHAPPVRAVRLQGGRPGARQGLDRAHPVRPPAARRRRGRPRRDATDVPAEKLHAPTSVRDDTVPEDLVDLAHWIAEEYCSTPARALAIVTPPPGKAKTHFYAEPTGDDGQAHRQAARAARTPPRPGRQGPRRAAPARGARPGHDQRTLRAPHAAHERRRGPRPRPHAAPDRRARGDRRAAAPTCCTASPARARPRSTSARRQACLARGEGVIVLVPEIALTPQTVARFQARFGDTVALLHSALSEGERYDEWRRLRTSEARIAVGPRSAVFAPVEQPRPDRPRRGARRLLQAGRRPALRRPPRRRLPRLPVRRAPGRRARPRRARRRSTPCTACGSPHAWRPRSRSSSRTIPRRPACTSGASPRARRSRPGAPTASRPSASWTCASPSTRCTPRRAARSSARASRSSCSTAAAGRTSSSCKTCGKAWECPRCDVALVLHRAQHEIACHHCGHKERVPKRCDACGSLAVARHGAGTERVEHELRGILDVPIFRLDADTTQTKDAVPELLARFHQAPTGLLLGTQMVAKGHDFPDVTLGVVLDADSTLRFPDFRAEERTFALIAQLAGRAGRGPKGGRVLVQTRSPDAPAIVAAANHDSDGFLRRGARAPQGARVPAVRGPDPRHHERHRPRARPRRRGRHRRADQGAGDELLGPAPLFRLRDRERFQLVLKTHERSAAIHATGRAPSRTPPATKAFKEVNFSVDVDPCLSIERDGGRGAWRGRRAAASGSIPRPARAAKPRSSTSASTATRCCARARWRSTTSTTRCARRSAGWAA